MAEQGKPTPDSTRATAHSPVAAAQLETTEAGVVVAGDGWFVVNARDARWWRHDVRGQGTELEGKHEFPELGFNLNVLLPGQHGVYHGERGQEDFLVVSGECVLVIEGEERRLQAWDFVHCPPWTRHVFVGAGDGPCAIVMAGSRVGPEVIYPVDELAAKYRASMAEETSDPGDTYAHFGPGEWSTFREGWLPS